MSSRPRGHRGRVALVAATALAAPLFACEEGLFVDPGAHADDPATIAVSYTVGPAAAGSGGPGQAFDQVDQIRARVSRTDDGSVLFDEIVDFDRVGSGAELSPIEIRLDSEDVALFLEVELSWQGAALLVGSAQVTLSAGNSSDVELTVDAIPAGITIDPVTAMNSLGETRQLRADVTFATGDVIPGLSVSWTLLSGGVVTLTSTGLLRSVGEGQADVMASYNTGTVALTETITVRVQATGITVRVDPDRATVTVGESQRFTAVVLDQNGNGLGRPVTWSVADPSKATVTAAGLATGLAPGTTEIVATADGGVGTATLTVTAEAPGVATLPATGVTPDAALLHGEVDPNGFPTTAWFEWGTSSGLASPNLTPGQSVGSSQTPVRFDAALGDLAPRTTYYYRGVGESQTGVARGQVLSFTTTSSVEIVTTTLPDAVLNAEYGVTLIAQGGTGTYTWTRTAGELPPGVALSSAGAISGIPTATGTYPFTVQVTSAGQSSSAQMSITVRPPLTITSPFGLPGATVDVAYGLALQATGGTGPYGWSLDSCCLPPGLELGQNGVINGSPDEEGKYTFTARVVSGSEVATKQHTIDVSPPTGTNQIRATVTVEESALPGVTVSVAGPTSSSGTTDVTGVVVFSGLLDGTYTVAISNVPVGITFPVAAFDITVSGGVLGPVSFFGSYIRTSAIIGTVSADGSPLPGVLVSLSGLTSGATLTDAGGQYAFTGLRAGSYTVAISVPGGFGFPVTAQQVTVGVGATAIANFSGAASAPPTISGASAPLVQANSESCRAILSPPEPLGSWFTLSFDYSDPNGDVTAGNVVVDVSYLWSNGGGGGWAAPPSGTPSVSGNGSNGSVSLPGCFRFGASTHVDVTMTLRDAGGNTSNPTTVRIVKLTPWNVAASAGADAPAGVDSAGGITNKVEKPMR